MHNVFLFARLYPYFTLAMILMLAQFGLFFRRKGSRAQWGCWFLVVVFAASTALWFYQRGDLHSDRWVKQLFLLN